jgi:hypothetical protein
MKIITSITWFIVVSALHAEERSAVKASSGRFEVTQEYQSDSDQGDGEFLEIVRFRDTGFPRVRLSGAAWPGIYSISPNEQWLLRTQKTGSGESVAMLYRVEENGRVSEVVGFDSILWGASDAASRLKQKELYHTGIAEAVWSEDIRFLEIVVRGSNASKSENGIECRIQYDLKSNRVVIHKPISSNEPHTLLAKNPEQL